MGVVLPDAAETVGVVLPDAPGLEAAAIPGVAPVVVDEAFPDAAGKRARDDTQAAVSIVVLALVLSPAGAAASARVFPADESAVQARFSAGSQDAPAA